MKSFSLPEDFDQQKSRLELQEEDLRHVLEELFTSPSWDSPFIEILLDPADTQSPIDATGSAQKSVDVSNLVMFCKRLLLNGSFRTFRDSVGSHDY